MNFKNDIKRKEKAMTENIREYLGRKLKAQGFSPFGVYSQTADILTREIYPAFISIKGIELSQQNAGTNGRCSADISTEVRLMGAKKGFFDHDRLQLMAERLVADLFFGSQYTVVKISCGEISRCIQLGRLECKLSVTFRAAAERGDAS